MSCTNQEIVTTHAVDDSNVGRGFVKETHIQRTIKAIIHFRNRKKKKVHRFTNNLQGLQKVMVKDFS